MTLGLWCPYLNFCLVQMLLILYECVNNFNDIIYFYITFRKDHRSPVIGTSQASRLVQTQVDIDSVVLRAYTLHGAQSKR